MSPKSIFCIVCTQMSSDTLSPRVAWKSRFQGVGKETKIYPYIRKLENSEHLVMLPTPTHLPNPEPGFYLWLYPDDTINHQVSAFKFFPESIHVSPFSPPLVHTKLSSLVFLYLLLARFPPKLLFTQEREWDFKFFNLFFKNVLFLYNVKGYFPFTVTTKYWLYCPFCTNNV